MLRRTFDLISSITPQIFFFVYCMGLPSCAVLYKVQLSDLDDRTKGKVVSVRVSENTVDLVELANLSKNLALLTKNKTLNSVGDFARTFAFFGQFGPKTGTPVFNEFYARGLPEMLANKCKNGRLVNLTSAREARSYPIVKGQIVRIDGLCLPKS